MGYREQGSSFTPRFPVSQKKYCPKPASEKFVKNVKKGVRGWDGVLSIRIVFLVFWGILDPINLYQGLGIFHAVVF